MQTLDINTLEWFDKVNGNTYFASRITINYGLETEKEFINPFQYGYSSQSEVQAVNTLKANGVLPNEFKGWLNEYCKNNNIILRINKRNGLKRELKNI